MVTIKRDFVPGNYFHIYNRGTSKQKIFIDESDKVRFKNLLYLCNGEKSFAYKDLSERVISEYSYKKGNNLLEICSWVLMNNHFHILVFIPENISADNISKFLGKLSSAYLKYFNVKYARTGNLFEGRFKSILVEDDTYLKYLYSYIHLNPLKMLNNNWKEEGLKIKNAEAYLNDYSFSSYHDLVLKKERPEKNILSHNEKVIELAINANNFKTLFSLITPTPGGRGTGVVESKRKQIIITRNVV